MSHCATVLWVGFLYALHVRAQKTNVPGLQTNASTIKGCVWSGTEGTIYTQGDADYFNGCETIYGEGGIEITNGTTQITLDDVKYIDGSLYIVGDGYPSSISTFSMKSLISVTGIIRVQGNPNLTAIDFPALSIVLGDITISDNPSLTAINLPQLTSVGVFSLESLPALERMSFDSGLKSVTGYNVTGNNDSSFSVTGYSDPSFTITNTSLSSIEGLLFPSIKLLYLTGNSYLTNLTLGIETISEPYQWTSKIEANPSLHLKLPSLKSTSGYITIADFISLEVPVLSSIKDSLSLEPGNMTQLSLPGLISADYLFIIAANLSLINLPSLHTFGGLKIIASPAASDENGIYLPSLLSGNDMFVSAYTQHSPTYCSELNNWRCRGIIEGSFSCGGDSVDVDSDPNECQNTYPISGWTLSKKLAVGFGVSFGVLGTIALAYCVFRYGRSRQRKRARREAQQTQQVDIELIDEQLPRYQQYGESDGDPTILPDYVEEEVPNKSSAAPETSP